MNRSKYVLSQDICPEKTADTFVGDKRLALCRLALALLPKSFLKVTFVCLQEVRINVVNVWHTTVPTTVRNATGRHIKLHVANRNQSTDHHQGQSTKD